MRRVLLYTLLLGLAVRARSDEAVENGRRVYIREGCIACHSQFVRPRVNADVQMWGPAAPHIQTSNEIPPLYGSRRQGPDLQNVGNRRSPEWQRWHLQNPRLLVPGSRMPSYAYLFARGCRSGEDVVAYLMSLGTDTSVARAEAIARWIPADHGAASKRDGQKTYHEFCAVCHGNDGRGDGPLSRKLSAPPPDFTRDGWRHLDAKQPALSLARVIKFGIPGTNMPGHEYLDDGLVIALANHVLELHDQPEGQP